MKNIEGTDTTYTSVVIIIIYTTLETFFDNIMYHSFFHNIM